MIASTGDRTSYAKHLLEIAATVVEGKQTAFRPGVSMARSADVETRIDAILDMDRPLAKQLSWKSTVCLVAIVLPAFWLAAALRADASAPSESETAAKPPAATDPAGDNAAVGSAKVSGRVVDEQGQPVSNAVISLVLYSHERHRDRDPAPPTVVWATTQSAQDGGFAMVYPAINDPDYYTKRACRLVAIAQKDGLALGWAYVEFSDKTTVAEIKLPKEEVRRGRLVGLEGQAVSGATVHVVGVGKPAPKWIQFRKYPFHDGMPADETTDTTIPVDEAERLWPHLIRFRHPPFGLPGWLKSATSDDNGVFEIRGMGADEIVHLHVYGTDQGGSKQHSLGSGSQTEPTTLLLDTPRTITGVVTDKRTGKPIAGAKVCVDGTILITAKMPIVADWKGRQDHVGNLYAVQSNNTMFDGPTAEAVTDKDGRYRLSAFGPRYGQPNFVLTVSSPNDKPYLSSRKWIAWPRKTTFLQQVDLQLTPGVHVTGQVVAADGRPTPHARVDFWSRELPYPYKEITQAFRNGFKVLPEGLQHPHWRKADGQGRFEMIVPHEESYLFVNQGTDETIVDRIAATEVGLPENEVRIPSPIGSFLPPHTSVESHRFYPDRAVRLKYAADAKSDELTIQLHPKAPTLTVEVVNPDGTPATNLTYLAGQSPFRYYALKLNRLIQKTGDNKFSIPCRDLKSPVSLAFLSADRTHGLHREIRAEEAGDKVVRLTLQPLGQAKVRFVDKDHKPLADFRPLLWMSIPRNPVSTATDLEQQTVTTDSRAYPLQQSFDSIWTSRLYKKTHGSLKTDAGGNAMFKSLIPGATYRLSQFDGQIRDFTVQAGGAVDLGDVVIHEPQRTQQLPWPAKPKVEASAKDNSKEDQAMLRGRVLNPSGQPLAGAAVWLSTIKKPLGRSNDEGRFQFRVPADKLRQLNAHGRSEAAQLAATADDMGFDFVNVGDADGEFELKLCKDLPIHGRFVDSEGKPIQGIEIRAVRVFEPGPAGLAPFIAHIQSGNTRFADEHFEKFWTGPVPAGQSVLNVDEQGRLSVAGYGAGRFVLFEFAASGIANDSVYILTHNAEPIRFKPSPYGVRVPPRLYYAASFTYVATPSRSINGAVFDKETDQPIAGATVYHSFGAAAQTDAKGRYVLEGHPKFEEGYLVRASAGFPYFGSQGGAPDTGGLDPVTVNIYLSRGIGAHGKVLDADTGAAITADVRYYPLFRDSPISGGRSFPATATVDPDGSFKLPVLSGPGVLAVRAAQIDSYARSDLTPKRSSDFFDDSLERWLQERLMTAGPEGSIGIPLAPSAFNALILINPKHDQQKVSQDIRLERADGRE